MNNLKYYQDGLAYDFSLFAPAEKIENSKTKNANITTIPDVERKRARIRKEAASRVTGKISAILVTVFVVLMLCGNIYLRSQINETEHKIAVINNDINEAESYLASINFELEQKISYKNLEQAAINLGMRKMDKNQIVYVRTVKEDKVVIGSGEYSAENKP